MIHTNEAKILDNFIKEVGKIRMLKTEDGRTYDCFLKFDARNTACLEQCTYLPVCSVCCRLTCPQFVYFIHHPSPEEFSLK